MGTLDKPTEFTSTVGRNARWALVQTVVSALTVFVLYKFLYSHLGPEQLGLWAVVLASVSVGRLAEMGFSTTVLRYVSKHLAGGDRARAARIVETGLISICGPFALVLLLLYPIAVEAMRYVVPAGNHAGAREILPYALGTLWFGVAGSITQSALDGCGRMDVKSKLLIVGNLVYVPAGILLAEDFGVLGLAIGQLLQSVLVTGLTWIATRRELTVLGWVPLKWHKDCFHEIIRYAAGLQLGNLLIMLFEPATKILLSRYCGLADVAHFEMANQVVARVRSLITSAMQAYLPVLSATTDIALRRRLVGEAQTNVINIGVPLMAFLVISYPIISFLWIGELQADFVAYGWILGIGWLLATLGMPAYFYCVAAGRIRTILASQVLMVSLNGFLGFGAAKSGLGLLVAISMMLSLLAENIVTTRRALLDLDITIRSLITTKEAASTLKTLLLLALVLISNISISIATSMGIYLYWNLLIHALILLLIVYMSDARTILAARVRRPL